MKLFRSVEWLEGVLEKDFVVQNDTDVISEDGLYQINAKLPVYLDGGDWEKIGMEATTKRGRFARRLSAHLYKSYDYKLDAHIVEEVGNIASRYTVKGGRYIVRADRELWIPGTFGDRSSCFFGGRRSAPKLIFRSGGAAIKLYDASDRAPISRAWLAPRLGRGAIFNVYTVEGKSTLTTDIVANLVTLDDGPFAGFGRRRIGRLNNYGYNNEVIWINNGSGTLIHRPGEPWIFGDLDLRIKIGHVCSQCGDMESELSTYEDSLYCPSCWPIRRCAECQIEHHTGAMHQFGEGHLCRACFVMTHRHCHECSHFHHTSRLSYEGNFNWMCERCMTRRQVVETRARSSLNDILSRQTEQLIRSGRLEGIHTDPAQRGVIPEGRVQISFERDSVRNDIEFQQSVARERPAIWQVHPDRMRGYFNSTVVAQPPGDTANPDASDLRIRPYYYSNASNNRIEWRQMYPGDFADTDEDE